MRGKDRARGKKVNALKNDIIDILGQFNASPWKPTLGNIIQCLRASGPFGPKSGRKWSVSGDGYSQIQMFEEMGFAVTRDGRMDIVSLKECS